MSKTIVLIVLLLASTSAGAADWSQWRGPDRDAASAAPGPSGAWPSELGRRWRTDVGLGQSSPVIAGDTVFVMTREGEMEVARALDLRTGAPRWRQAYRAPHEVYPGAASFGSGPKSTPVVSDGRLFTFGISGMLTAFDVRDGRIAWQKDFAGRFPATAPPFGTSMSPLVVHGLLIVHAGGHDGGALIAFDPATGRERWTLEGDGPSYSSPILTSFEGQEHLVLQVHRRLIGVDPASGRLLWSLPFVTPCDQNIVTPLRAGDVLVVSSQDTGTQGIRVTRQGGQWTPQVVWHTQQVSMYMSSPVLVNGLVVGLSHRKKGQYFALDPATGNVRTVSAAGRGENAAFVRVADALLLLRDDGTLLVLPGNGSSFDPVRQYHVTDSATYAHPVPTSLGLLIKDESGLGLYGWGARP